MSPLSPPLDYLSALDRYNFLVILNAARECEEDQFAKQACMLWLSNYPGDLYVQYQQGLTYTKLGLEQQAKSIFDGLIELDPLFIEPIRSRLALEKSKDNKKYLEMLLTYLTQREIPDSLSEEWVVPLSKARLAFSQGDYEKATALVHQALVYNPQSPLPAILHLKSAYKIEDTAMLANLCEIYHQQYPNCLQINIIKALSEIDNGQEAAGVERLHWAAAHDTAGQAVQRLLGKNHRFKTLWPEKMEIYFDLAIPASINAILGWNQLHSGSNQLPEEKVKIQPQETNKTKTDVQEEMQTILKSQGKFTPEPNENHEQPEDEKPSPDLKSINPHLAPEKWATKEDFEDIRKSFDRLAKRFKKSDLERSDNRFPVYVILSSRKQLESIYGPNTTGIINDHLQQLVDQIRGLPEWNAMLFYPDDPAQMAQLGLKPILASDAWKVKLALRDLDQALAKQGEMIGALLIVGGPKIIPFHNLPNPTTDNDLDVPSDNPYATIDENYFIPQWPVGRLPGETGSDAGLLLYQIRHLLYQYEQKSKKGFPVRINFNILFAWLRHLFSNWGVSISNQKNLGCSAQVWQEPSAVVFATIDRAKELLTSPPINSSSSALNNGKGSDLGYFNLHGIKDGPNWYGQKDFSSGASGPDYPIALTPAQFNEHIPSPEVVFTEACYGAHIDGKHHEEAMSLKFLDSGTTSFVGSTCIAYGSVTLPLIAADYLAKEFWQHVLQGDPVGIALMRAKLNLAQRMTQLQGFLDGEDQKTILSFVLFGDPLSTYDGFRSSPKPLFRIKNHPKVKTVSDSELESENESAVPENIQAEVKQILEKYLPGLDNAQKNVFHTSVASAADKKGSRVKEDRFVVTLKKSLIDTPQTTHHHFARLTFDKSGKLIKLSTSR